MHKVTYQQVNDKWNIKGALEKYNITPPLPDFFQKSWDFCTIRSKVMIAAYRYLLIQLTF